MKYFAGVDVGSSTTKCVIINDSKELLCYTIQNSGTDFKAAAELAFKQSKNNAKNKISNRCLVIATGYGRKEVSFAESAITEISCHAKGSYFYYPHEHTLIDIGGQDSKVIKIDKYGKRIGFRMNRKCAAGTGAFLEEIANRLQLNIDDLNELAERAQKDIQIGSYCTVFTATEILARIREGVKLEDIVKGIFGSVIKRAIEMDPLQGNIAMSGGVVAHNPFLVKMFEEKLGKKIFVSPLPQYNGAFGAALYALEEKEALNA